jgi:hypothetical protein
MGQGLVDSEYESRVQAIRTSFVRRADTFGQSGDIEVAADVPQHWPCCFSTRLIPVDRQSPTEPTPVAELDRIAPGDTAGYLMRGLVGSQSDFDASAGARLGFLTNPEGGAARGNPGGRSGSARRSGRVRLIGSTFRAWNRFEAPRETHSAASRASRHQCRCPARGDSSTHGGSDAESMQTLGEIGHLGNSLKPRSPIR